MVVSRGVRKIEFWYLDPQDAKQEIVIEGDNGEYEVTGGVVRIMRGDRTIIVPLSRLIMIDDRFE